jgi:hypothetical protein
MRLSGIVCILLALGLSAPLGARERAYAASRFQVDLDGPEAGWVRSTYARHAGGQAIANDQLRVYLQHLQAGDWDRARVEREIIAAHRRAKAKAPRSLSACIDKRAPCANASAPAPKPR